MKAKFLLFVSLFLIVCIITVNADTSFNVNTAKSIFLEGYRRVVLFHNTKIPAGHKLFEEDEILFENHKELVSVNLPFMENGYVDKYVFTKSSDGKEFPYQLRDAYGVMVDERFNTVEKCYDYMESYFTKDLTNRILKKHPAIELHAECVRLSDGGLMQKGNELVPITKDMVMYFRSFNNLPSINNFEIQRYIGFEENDVTAKIEVLINHVYFYPQATVEEGPGEYINLEKKDITFEKTGDGWRISGGSFIELLLTDPTEATCVDNIASIPPAYNPSTGDNTAPLVIAAFASLLPLAWFGLRRKRVF